MMDKREVMLVLGPTLLYWAWETVAAGNIRIDLLLIYPLLFVVYVVALWRKRGWYALPIAAAVMAVNVLYGMASYELFDKYPG